MIGEVTAESVRHTLAVPALKLPPGVTHWKQE